MRPRIRNASQTKCLAQTSRRGLKSRTTRFVSGSTPDKFVPLRSLHRAHAQARFDGKLYEMQDDPGHTMVSVKLINPYTVEQTNVRDGKIAFIVTLEVTPDGKTIHATSKSKEDGSVKHWTLQKQSK